MKAIEQYFHVVLYITAVQRDHNFLFKSVDETLEPFSSTPMWYIAFYCRAQRVLTFKSVDETLVCDHSNESY